jgi:hypothetical protein
MYCMYLLFYCHVDVGVVVLCCVCWVATWPIMMIIKVLLLAVGAVPFSGARMPEIHKQPILNSSDSLVAATTLIPNFGQNVIVGVDNNYDDEQPMHL